MSIGFEQLADGTTTRWTGSCLSLICMTDPIIATQIHHSRFNTPALVFVRHFIEKMGRYSSIDCGQRIEWRLPRVEIRVDRTLSSNQIKNVDRSGRLAGKRGNRESNNNSLELIKSRSVTIAGNRNEKTRRAGRCSKGRSRCALGRV